MSEPSASPDPTTDATTAPQTIVARVRQPHGGYLNAGGTPGNRGGGSTPNKLRQLCRKDFKKAQPLLLKIAQGKLDEVKVGEEVVPIKMSDRIRAIEVLAKVGMDATIGLEDVRACLKLTNVAIYEFLPREQADVLWQRILPHWLTL